MGIVGTEVRRRPLQTALLSVLLLAAILIPRLTALDRYVTDDERRWLNRAANFTYALTQQQFAATYQREHPGVTVMWAGAAAFFLRFPAYAANAPGLVRWDEEGFEPTARSQGQDPLALLALARTLLVCLIALTLMLTFAAAIGWFGLWPAWVGLMLIALDPFHIGLSRLLHLDALASSTLILALLAFGRALEMDAHWRRHLVLASAAAGLSWLTKSPGLILVPFLALYAVWVGWRPSAQRGIVTSLLAYGLWLLMASALYVALWPAMWVAPLATLRNVLSTGVEYAAGERLSTIFFAGNVLKGDPGPLFYPVNWFWRTSPVVLIGLGLAIGGYIRRIGLLGRQSERRRALWLCFFALLYVAALTTSIQKFDRYLLPIVPPLALLAGLGWTVPAVWLHRKFKGSDLDDGNSWIPRSVAPVLLVHLLWISPAYPYFLSYYNPLAGGSARAPEVMMIGRGEGLDQAAAWLNAQPDAGDQQVLAWSRDNISYLLRANLADPDLIPDPGEEAEADQLLQWLELDYIVLYVHQWQRRLIEPAALDYLATQIPVHVVRINGLEYARIYATRGEPPPFFERISPAPVIDWRNAIRLTGHDLEAAAAADAEPFKLTAYLQNLAPLATNYNVQVRVVDRNGNEAARSDGWPWGRATSTWEWYEVWPDGHLLDLGEPAPQGLYRIEYMIYDPETLDPLPMTDALSRTPVDAPLVVDYIEIGDIEIGDIEIGDSAVDLAAPMAIWGEQIGLLDVALTVNGQALKSTSLAAAEELGVRLRWQTQQQPDANYNLFLHLLAADGRIAAQQDQPLLNGFVPTRLWRPGFVADEQVDVALPQTGLEEGEYRLVLGLYDPADGQRLLTTTGDSVALATFQVE